MKANEIEKIALTFEQEDYSIPQAIEYYVGLEGPTIVGVKHPDNLWSILDRMHTMVLDDNSGELEEEQKNFLHHFLEKWMNEIQPYCVRLESE